MAGSRCWGLSSVDRFVPGWFLVMSHLTSEAHGLSARLGFHIWSPHGLSLLVDIAQAQCVIKTGMLWAFLSRAL